MELLLDHGHMGREVDSVWVVVSLVDSRREVPVPMPPLFNSYGRSIKRTLHII